MPLSTYKTIFKDNVKSKLLDFNNNTDPDKSAEDSIDEFVELLANEIETWIKAGTVTTTVTGTSATGGPVAGSGTGKIE